jgi:hypothetical protein
MCGTMPPTLYAFMSRTETALIAIITCCYFPFNNRQDPVSKMYCTFNCVYFPLRGNAMYSGKKINVSEEHITSIFRVFWR